MLSKSSSVVLAALAVSACSVGDSGAPTEITGAHGRFVFELQTGGALREGKADLSVVVRDASTQAAVPHADVAFHLLMPAMGHASEPLSVESTPANYRADGAILDMPGAWVLRVHAASATTDDDVEFDLDVP